MPIKNKSKNKNIWKNWLDVEERIEKEKDWLNGVINRFTANDRKSSAFGCPECFLRKIAILIISGKVRATEMKRSGGLKSFWLTPARSLKITKYRGSLWHRTTTAKISEHFRAQGYQIATEPDVYGGRADLVAWKDGESRIYVEVGTVSLLKLYLNFLRMKETVFLVVSNDNRIIEFVC